MYSLFNPRKRFGQNFLQDKNIIGRIVDVIAPQKHDHIVEIGPGLGALTTELLPIINEMDVVELDRDLIPKLQTACKALGELRVHQADALKFDFSKLTTNLNSLRIVGNLPYNISTTLLFHLLQYIKYIKDMHFMLQKEVVDRLAAKIGSKQYGRLSVMMQYFCQITKLFTVAPGAFYPVPKVDSAIVKLIPHKEIIPATKDIEIFTKVVKQGFSQRRKTIKNNLKNIISSEQLINLNIDPKTRPEQLTVADFVNLSNLTLPTAVT